MDLFEFSGDSKSAPWDANSIPLAEYLRPQTFADFVGQAKLIKQIQLTGKIPNLILWGPPGTGKTTFANLIAKSVDAEFLNLNAIDTGAKELREQGQKARMRRLQFGRHTILFIDEIHRLNKAQQDVLLPFAERGDLTLIGATTENPSYELNHALLSRARVLIFERLTAEHLKSLLQKACDKLKIVIDDILTADAQNQICELADGDGRQVLNLFEQVVSTYKHKNGDGFPLDATNLDEVVSKNPLAHDKASEAHYDTISAFIKSIRGSDPDAAIYYLARMLEGGESPVFIARRLVILASEDVGLADSQALPLAVAGLSAVELVGMPEAAINLAHVTIYLAITAKSNRSYLALGKAKEVVEKTGKLPIPLELRSSRTAFSRGLGYGKGYIYPHSDPLTGAEKETQKVEYLPKEIRELKFYYPSASDPARRRGGKSKP